jgi:hypothetical protein
VGLATCAQTQTADGVNINPAFQSNKLNKRKTPGQKHGYFRETKTQQRNAYMHEQQHTCMLHEQTESKSAAHSMSDQKPGTKLLTFKQRLRYRFASRTA